METEKKTPLILAALQFKDLAVIDLPDDATPEQLAEIEAAWVAELERTWGVIEERFLALYKAMEREKFKARQHDPEIEALEQELALRKAGRDRHVAHLERMKRYAVKCLQEIGRPVETEGLVFKAQKNGGRAVVAIVDRDAIPEQYRVQQPWAPDTIGIANDVEKEGKTVPGATVSRGFHLRIAGA